MASPRVGVIERGTPTESGIKKRFQKGSVCRGWGDGGSQKTRSAGMRCAEGWCPCLPWKPVLVAVERWLWLPDEDPGASTSLCKPPCPFLPLGNQTAGNQTAHLQKNGTSFSEGVTYFFCVIGFSHLPYMEACCADLRLCLPYSPLRAIWSRNLFPNWEPIPTYGVAIQTLLTYRWESTRRWGSFCVL